jgi:predicted dehydrogenase
MQEQELLAGRIPSQESWCPAPTIPDGVLHTEINGEVIRKDVTSQPGNYMGFFDDLHRSLTTNSGNPVPPEDGIKTIKIIEAALRSAKEGTLVQL